MKMACSLCGFGTSPREAIRKFCRQRPLVMPDSRFSPDSNYIYCVRRDESEHTLASLYSSPVLGGTPRLLIKDVDSPITFSPDGQRFAFLREDHDSPTYELIVANSDGSFDRTPFQRCPTRRQRRQLQPRVVAGRQDHRNHGVRASRGSDRGCACGGCGHR